MMISKEYEQLMSSPDLTDRFRAGDYSLYGDERAVLEGFIDSFYGSVKQSGYVPMDDFFAFMDLLDLIKDGDTDEVQDLTAYAFVECAKLRSAVGKQKRCEKQADSGLPE